MGSVRKWQAKQAVVFGMLLAGFQAGRETAIVASLPVGPGNGPFAGDVGFKLSRFPLDTGRQLPGPTVGKATAPPLLETGRFLLDRRLLLIPACGPRDWRLICGPTRRKGRSAPGG
jgi:hypothetical protein